jgi:Fe-S cluster assembly ATP-binding protein
MKVMKEKMAMLQIDHTLLSRSINEGFSGGEKKRNEIFQMAILDPRLTILDEMDSGLDIDALRVVAHGINQLRTKDNALLIITHYQRLLEYITPDFVHVLYNGNVVRSGTKELALELEQRGYDFIKEEAGLAETL